MIDEIKTVSTVEELYKSNGAPTGEIIVDAVVDNVKRTTTHSSADIALLLKVKNLAWLSDAMQLLVGLPLQEFIFRWRLMQAIDLLDNPELELSHLGLPSSSGHHPLRLSQRHRAPQRQVSVQPVGPRPQDAPQKGCRAQVAQRRVRSKRRIILLQSRHTDSIGQIFILRSDHTDSIYQICMPRSDHTDFIYQICMPRSDHTDFIYQICMPRSDHTDSIYQICMLRSDHTDFIYQNCMPRPEHTDFIYQNCMPRPEHTDFICQNCMPRSEHTDFIHQNCMLLQEYNDFAYQICMLQCNGSNSV